MIFLKSQDCVFKWRFCDMWQPDVQFCEGGQVTPPPIPAPPPSSPHSSLISCVPPPPPVVCGVEAPNTHNQCCKVARQKFRPKSSKGATEKKFLAEFWLILPKTGRKGATENFQKKFLIFSCDNCDKFDF